MSVSERARRGALRVLSRVNVHPPTTVAGTTARFVTLTPNDAHRATHLEHEEEAALWLFDDIGPDDVFWDVGAHQGHWSIIAARRGAIAIAFEPSESRTRIRENLSLNRLHGEVHIQAVVLTDRGGWVQMSPKGPSMMTVDPGGETRKAGIRGDDVQELAPDRLKIDVEGHELHVLDGMPKRLAGVDRVLVEVHDPVEPAAVRERLEAAGLETLEIDTPRSQPHIAGRRRSE